MLSRAGAEGQLAFPFAAEDAEDTEVFLGALFGHSVVNLWLLSV